MTEINESSSLAELATALAKAQGSMRSAKKDSTNPHFKSKYADLASVWDACREPLSSNGLAVIQRVSPGQDGVVISTMLVHSSGQWVKDTCLIPLEKKTAQGVGSAITYGRRYALSAMVGIASDEDDDGNQASAQNATTGTEAKSQTENVKSLLKAKIGFNENQKPHKLTVSFGPLKGKSIAELKDEELSSIVDEYSEKLSKHPGAKWTGEVNDNLNDLLEEVARRESQSPGGQT